jgi:hypothetical protein
VEHVIWLKTAAQVWPSALMHYHDEFSMHHTAIFLVIYGNQHHGNVLVFLNKYAGLQFGFARSINGAQHLF